MAGPQGPSSLLREIDLAPGQGRAETASPLDCDPGFAQPDFLQGFDSDEGGDAVIGYPGIPEIDFLQSRQGDEFGHAGIGYGSVTKSKVE